ncbi:MAG: hypothetical protein Q8R76_00170 [Candidatus Omnitrophota bacterium]|nr:hypothetical protein [Candidatus Omnitrophota bacterium]
MRIFSKTKRLTSLVIAIFFTTFTVLQNAPKIAQAATPAQPAPSSLVSSLPSFTVPTELGHIDSFYNSGNPRTVFYIQDAHTSLEAQKNIAQIIDRLVDQQGVRRVFEEGYQGAVPSDEYFPIPDKKLKQETSYFFLDHLRLSAAEYAHINRKQDFALIGTDNLKLYLENLNWYRKAARVRKLVRQDVMRLEKHLGALETRLFPKNFQKWWELRKRFDSDKIQIPDYLVRTAAFYTGLAGNSATAKDLLAAQYPNIDVFTKIYKKDAEEAQIDYRAIFGELTALEEAISGRLLAGEDAVMLYLMLRFLGSLKRLSVLEASRDGLELYRENKGRIDTRKIVDFIYKHTQTAVILSRFWEKEIGDMIRFYEVAIEREQAIQPYLEQDWKEAALVYGGFHKEGILDMLRRQGISYYVISPAMSGPDPVHEKRYRALMEGKHYRFEEGMWRRRSGEVDTARAAGLYIGLKGPTQSLVTSVADGINRSELREGTRFEESLSARLKSDLSRWIAGRQDSTPQGSEAAPLFTRSANWLESLGLLDELLLQTRDKPLVRDQVLRAYEDYLGGLLHFAHAKTYFERLTEIAQTRERSSYVQGEIISRVADAVLRNEQVDEADIKTAFLELKTVPSMRRPLSRVFEQRGWGTSVHEYFRYRDVPNPSFAEVFPDIGSLVLKNPSEIYRRFYRVLGARRGAGPQFSLEVKWFKEHLYGDGDIAGFGAGEWRRIYEAMVDENQYVITTRLGGFRGVRGKRRFRGKLKRLALWRPKAADIIAKISRVYGYSADDLKTVIQDTLESEAKAEGLSDKQWLLIYERLDAANKKNFSKLDQTRYKAKTSLWRRIVRKPYDDFQRIKRLGILGLLFGWVDDILVLALGIFVRLPLHLVEIFMGRYYRHEVIYEHRRQDEDFLGAAQSDLILRNAIREIAGNEHTIADKWRGGVSGFLSRAADRTLLGSLTKATASFTVRRSYLAVLHVIAVGILATLGVAILSSGVILTTSMLATATSGIVGLGSIFAWLNAVPILNHLVVPLTVGRVGLSVLMAIGLVLPLTVIQKYRSLRGTNPEAWRAWHALRAVVIDTLLSPRFWITVVVMAIGLLLIGAEISAMIQYAVALDILILGSAASSVTADAINANMTDYWQDITGQEGLHPLSGVVSGKVHVEGISEELEGPLFTRAAAFVEHDALSWGNQAVDLTQNSLGFNLSDWIFHRMGGDPELSAQQVWQMADVLAYVRAAQRSEDAAGLNAEEAENNREAQVLQTGIARDQGKLKVLAYDLLYREPDQAAALLAAMDANEVGLIAGAYVTNAFESFEAEVSALTGALEQASPAHHAVFSLAGETARINLGHNPEAEQRFILRWQALADENPEPDRELLGAVTTVLDDVPTGKMASLLERADRNQWTAYVFNEAVLRHLTRKKRFVELRRAVTTATADSAVTGGEADVAAQAEASRDRYFALLNQDHSDRAYAIGDAYPKMLSLFARAYEATKDPEWYNVMEQATRNMLGNQDLPALRIAPKYEHVSVERATVSLDGAAIDLFDAITNGVPGYRLRVEHKTAPPFEVGYSDELEKTIREDSLEIIDRVIIETEDGKAVDTLTFTHDGRGVLSAIQSKAGLVTTRQETADILSQVTVFGNRPGQALPSGMVYRYVYNAFGELQYIVEADRIVGEESVKKTEVNTVLKDARGKTLTDVPIGLKATYAHFRSSEALDAPILPEAFGSILHALADVRAAARTNKDWQLAADTERSASELIMSFFALDGAIHADKKGQLFFYSDIDETRGTVTKVTLSDTVEASLADGLGRWAGELEAADELREHIVGPEAETTADKPFDPASVLDHVLRSEALEGLRQYIRYGTRIPDFKFSKVTETSLRIPKGDEDAVFLEWEPIDEARWYLVREFHQDAEGKWDTDKSRDHWVRQNYFNVQTPAGKPRRYVVMGFTSDLIFESYGPFNPIKSTPSEPVVVEREHETDQPAAPTILLPERHFVNSSEEWIDLDATFRVLAVKFQSHPGARGVEWEIATDKNFEDIVKTVTTEKDKLELFLRGIPNGRYYLRVRLWSGEKAVVDRDWIDLDSVTVNAPDVAIQLDSNLKVSLRDDTVLTWPGRQGTPFYRVRIWYQDGTLERFAHGAIITRTPFINVRAHTSKPVNRIEITPYSGDPELSGYAGPSSGNLVIDEIPGVANLQPMAEPSVIVSKSGDALSIPKVDGARVYRVERIIRGPRDSQVTETDWVTRDSLIHPLQRPALYARVQAWSDTPANAGEPLSDYSEWVKTDVDFEVPSAVDDERIQVAERTDPDGAKVYELTFPSVEGVAGYWVKTRNVRGGAYTYWAAQPEDSTIVSVRLVQDADLVSIQSTTGRVQGKLSDTVRSHLSADISRDNQTAPYRVIEETAAGDFNRNERQDPDYLFYDVSAIEVRTGERAYIQYATQRGNEETHVYGPSWARYFYPSYDADRMQSRIIRLTDTGELTVSDWSDWRDVKVRVDAPPAVSEIAADASDENGRTFKIAELDGVIAASQPAVGYAWETRMDLNDPADELRRYDTFPEFYNGRVIDRGDTVRLSRNARYIRGKVIYRTPHGDIESETWSKWQEIDTNIEEPSTMPEVTLSGKRRVNFPEHADPRVNAYVIEVTNDPNDNLQPVQSFERRILRETRGGESVVVGPNNFYDVPVNAKYVRVTPAIIYDEKNRILGQESDWVRLDIENDIVLPRSDMPWRYGRVIVGKSLRDTTHFEYEFRDRYGVVRNTITINSFSRGTGDFLAYRMRPVRGTDITGEFVYEAQGEWTPWITVKEQDVAHEPKSPAGFRVSDEVEGLPLMLRWEPEYLNERYKILNYRYVLEFEDRFGNRHATRSMETIVTEFPSGTVRARIKAVRSRVDPLGESYVESESDWTPWLDIPERNDLESVVVDKITVGRLQREDYFVIHLKPIRDPRVEWLHLEEMLTTGEYRYNSHIDRKSVEANGWVILIPTKQHVASVRVAASKYSGYNWPPRSTGRFMYSSPIYSHNWVKIPGREVTYLETPEIIGVTQVQERTRGAALRWTPVNPVLRDKRILYVVRGFDSEGMTHYYPKTYGTGAYVSDEKEGSVVGRLRGGTRFYSVRAHEVSEYESGYHESRYADLVPVGIAPPTEPVSEAPVEVNAESAGLLHWPAAQYEITIRDTADAAAAPVILLSEEPYAPDSALPAASDAYEVEVKEIEGFVLHYVDGSGRKGTVATGLRNSVNLAELLPGDYHSLEVRYVVKGEFLGEHSGWSESRVLNVKHDGNLLYIRPTGDLHFTAYFADGTEVAFFKDSKEVAYGVLASPAGPKQVSAEELPGEYHLLPSEIFDSGISFDEIDPNGDAAGFYAANFARREVMQNGVWAVSEPVGGFDRPFHLLGIASSGTLHASETLGLSDGTWSRASKSADAINAGLREATWLSAETGMELVTRRYLAQDVPAGITQLQLKDNGKADAASMVLALGLSPDITTGEAEVKRVGDYVTVRFGSGQFAAVPAAAVSGWYLGPDASAAERDPSLQSGPSSYSGIGERAVVYLRGEALTDANFFIISGEGEAKDLLGVITSAAADAANYEQTHAALANNGFRRDILPGPYVRDIFVDKLSGRTWVQVSEEEGAYRALIGNRPSSSLNALWTDSITGADSANVAVLNVRMAGLPDTGSDLVASRIIPNTNWLMRQMQLPTDAFSPKLVQGAMRFNVADGTVTLDNQNVAVVVSDPKGIYIPGTMAIRGSGVRAGLGGGEVRDYALNDTNNFEMRLAREEDLKVDPTQESLSASRVYRDAERQLEVQENVRLVNGEQALRYQLVVKAGQGTTLESVSVGLSDLDAEPDAGRNPEGIPGFEGHNALYIAGVDRVFHADELFERAGLGTRDRGKWIDLLSLFQSSGELNAEGLRVKAALKNIGALGVLGWDKAGIAYPDGGIDYDSRYRVMVRFDERENDRDGDTHLEVTDIRIEIPASGPSYESPEIAFTRLGVNAQITDEQGMPEDLKYLVHEWIRRVDGDVTGAPALDVDDASVGSVIALWDTADLILSRARQAHSEGRTDDYARLMVQVREISLRALRGTVRNRDTDAGGYEETSVDPREDVAPIKGRAGLYGAYAASYAKAGAFFERVHELEADGLPVVFSQDSGGAYGVIIRDAETKAADYFKQAAEADSPKDAERYRDLGEIYLSKAEKFRVLRLAGDPADLRTRVAAVAENGELADPLEELRRQYFLLHGNHELAHSERLDAYRTSTDVAAANYWNGNVLLEAERIVKLQNIQEDEENYGAFYRDEREPVARLDDNGRKLWALRLAYEAAGKEIRRLFSNPLTDPRSYQRLAALHVQRQEYARAANRNIKAWLRVDERDGHLYGWETPTREQDNGRRDAYGNAVYRAYGLASWMDLIPEAITKFDASSAKHTQEHTDGRRSLTPLGLKAQVSDDDGADQADVPTSLTALETQALVSRAQGGLFADPLTGDRLTLAGTDEAVDAKIYIQDHITPLAEPLTHKETWIGLAQMAVQLTVIKVTGTWLARKAKQVWRDYGHRLPIRKFSYYIWSLMMITLVFFAWQYSLYFDIQARPLEILVFIMMAFVTKSFADGFHNYFNLGNMPDPHQREHNATLDARPFRNNGGPARLKLPMHQTTLLGTPIYSAHEEAARTAHGLAYENEGAFHNSIVKNFHPDATGLHFHINDQSPDKEGDDGFNAKKFHENYTRDLTRLHGRGHFYYTHQSGNADKKLGAVELMDSWWYALREGILTHVDALWESLDDRQRERVKRVAYGTTEILTPAQTAAGSVFLSEQSDLRLTFNDNGTVDMELAGVRARGVLIPDEDGGTVSVDFLAGREDGLTAVLPVRVERSGENLVFYYYNEDPNGDNVTIKEVLNHEIERKEGLLPIEKNAMIEEEARALLYRYWANVYGGTAEVADAPEEIFRVITGTAKTLDEGIQREVEIALGGREVTDAAYGWDGARGIALPGGTAAALSRAMVSQSLEYYDRVDDIAVWNGKPLSALHAEVDGLPIPTVFDSRIKAWTDTALLSDEDDQSYTVPFKTEVGKRAVPGQYYRVSDDGTQLVPYDNPALATMDGVTHAFDEAQRDGKKTNFEKKKQTDEELAHANQILKNIRYVDIVKQDYRVRYNAETGQVEILEERWLLYEYTYSDGSRQAFFRPERLVRFDTFVGHLPSIGAITNIWRLDEDTTADLGDGEEGTLVAGALQSGHPLYQPIMEPETHQNIIGYGGMVFHVWQSNADATLWMQMESRAREQSNINVKNEWLALGQGQYTGKAIENLAAAHHAKTHRMAEGFYVSHDILEPGYMGSGHFNMRLKRELKKKGLLTAFEKGPSHHKYARAVAFIVDFLESPTDPGRVVLRRYGRHEMTKAELEELLSYDVPTEGGFGLLTDMVGYEESFTSHENSRFKPDGQWKRGDLQFYQATWGGVDIRGSVTPPRAMPGYIISHRKTLEQSALVKDGQFHRVFVGQEYKPSPVHDGVKYFIARVNEADHRGGAMFTWLVIMLVLAAFFHAQTFNPLSLIYRTTPFAALLFMMWVMRSSIFLRYAREEGMTLRNATNLYKATKDMITSTMIIGGVNAWKSLLSTFALSFRAPTMKWVTMSSVTDHAPGIGRIIAFYTVSFLLGLVFVAYIIALHPSMGWLVYGSLFVGAFLTAPILAWITAREPKRAAVYMGIFKVLVAAAAVAMLTLPLYSEVTYAGFGYSVLKLGLTLGKGAAVLLGVILAYKVLRLTLPPIFRRAFYLVRHSLEFIGAGITWLLGLVSFRWLLMLDAPFRQHFPRLFHAGEGFHLSSIRDYFFTKGIDPHRHFSASYKGIGNIILIAVIWGAPLIFSGPLIHLLGGSLGLYTGVTGFYVGTFFPTGLLVVEKVLRPQRPWSWKNPFDYPRAVLNLAAALVGNAVGLIAYLLRTTLSLLATPYHAARVNRFIRVDLDNVSGEKSRKLARDTANVLSNGSKGLRESIMSRLAIGPKADEKLHAIKKSGMLDDKQFAAVAEMFFADRPGDTPVSVERSELRQAAEAVPAQAEPVRSKKERPRTRTYLEIVSDIRGLRGAVAVDARSAASFSPAQKEELVKLALAGRAAVVIYDKDRVAAKELAEFKGVAHIGLIPEGVERTERLLSRFGQVVWLFADGLDPRSEINAETQAAVGKRMKLFRQLNNEEEGLVTAALLKLRYGNAYRAFRRENGVYELTDYGLIELVQNYLAQEILSAAA